MSNPSSMSYEEFLDLPVSYIKEFVKNIKYKRRNGIPFNDGDLKIQKHLKRYTEELKIQEKKAQLEFMFSLEPYIRDEE